FDVSTGEEFCEQSESYCFPPNWDVWGGAAGGGSNDDFGYPTLDRAVGEAVENIGEDANEPSAAGRRPIDEGCAAAAAPAAASWALMLLGLLGFRRRRR
ncbi:MAG: MYXO-CTERM domain-containing protein, partial [Flavobacteriales bacterium]